MDVKNFSDYTFAHQVCLGMSIENACGRFFLRQLSDYVWDKYDDSLVDEAPKLEEISEELQSYGITDIKYDIETGIVTLWSTRPGRIIGTKGDNINRIIEHFRKVAKKNAIKFKTIRLEEDKTPLTDDLFSSIFSYQTAHDLT